MHPDHPFTLTPQLTTQANPTRPQSDQRPRDHRVSEPDSSYIITIRQDVSASAGAAAAP